jgi:hypothetical protein
MAKGTVLNIREMDPGTLATVKSRAAMRRITLREAVVEALREWTAKPVGFTSAPQKISKPAKAEAVPVVEADPAPQYFGDTLPPNSEIEKVEPAIQSWKDPARTYLPDLATERAARKPLTKPGTKKK